MYAPNNSALDITPSNNANQKEWVIFWTQAGDFSMLAVRGTIQYQRRRVDAITQSGGLWSVRKNVTEVGGALLATHFIADHAVRSVAVDADVAGRSLPKTRPTGAGIKLVRRIEQGSATTHAAICTRVVAIPIRAGKRWLGAALAAHSILLRCQRAIGFD